MMAGLSCAPISLDGVFPGREKGVAVVTRIYEWKIIFICNQVRIVGGNEAKAVFGWRFLLLRKQPATKHVKIDVLEIVKSLGGVKTIWECRVIR